MRCSWVAVALWLAACRPQGQGPDAGGEDGASDAAPADGGADVAPAPECDPSKNDPALTIESPPHGSRVGWTRVAARARVSGASPVAVILGGIPAEPEGEFHWVYELPVEPGRNVLRAVALDADGEVRTACAEFTGAESRAELALNASPEVGESPLTVGFSVANQPAQAEEVGWDLDGDGAFELSAPAEHQQTYLAPRDYTPRLRIRMPDGLWLSAAARVSLYLPAVQIDAPAEFVALDMDTDPEGRILLLNGSANRVVELGADGSPGGAFDVAPGAAGLGAAPERKVYFAYPEGRVEQYDAATGAKVATITPPESGGGPLVQPADVAYEKYEGRLLVLERTPGRVREVGSTHARDLPAAEGPIPASSRLLVNDLQRLYVVDTPGRRVVELLPDGSPVGQFGPEAGAKELQEPVSAAVDPVWGEVGVADRAGGRVVLYGRYDRRFRRAIEGFLEGSSRTALQRPAAIAFGRERLRRILYVSDEVLAKTVRLELAEADPLQAWRDLRQALVAADLPRALEQIHIASRERYRELFTAVHASARLSEMAAEMPAEPIPTVRRGGEALYRLLRPDGEGFRSYEMVIATDPDRAWKVLTF